MQRLHTVLSALKTKLKWTLTTINHVCCNIPLLNRLCNYNQVLIVIIFKSSIRRIEINCDLNYTLKDFNQRCPTLLILIAILYTK